VDLNSGKVKKFESRPIVEEVIEQEEELLEDAELDPQAREQDIIISQSVTA
jgi:hypothetical protein